MKESLLGFMPFVPGHTAPDRNRRGGRHEEDRADWVAWQRRGVSAWRSVSFSDARDAGSAAETVSQRQSVNARARWPGEATTRRASRHRAANAWSRRGKVEPTSGLEPLTCGRLRRRARFGVRGGFAARSGGKMEPTSGLEPLTCSLRDSDDPSE
jgi:uncharacterized protein YcbX